MDQLMLERAETSECRVQTSEISFFLTLLTASSSSASMRNLSKVLSLAMRSSFTEPPPPAAVPKSRWSELGSTYVCVA